jgi:choline dehydrogenase-like flavoprotein
VINCDVLVIGSGAGGGTIAGVLAAAGRAVVVLEAGGAHTERHFRQEEYWAHENLYYRGGPGPTADGNVILSAGATLGGGTTINWQNWVAPSANVRAEWAEHGLTDLATTEFDRHLAAVSARVGANGDCSDRNGPHQRLVEGADKLGWSWRPAVRNSDPARHNPALAGYAHFGDLTGAKQGTLKTYLADASAAGAKILVRTHADRIERSSGRGGTVHASGPFGQITVNAKDIVVAGGALETPALLLRSGLGGPAVGRNLHLHPATMVFGEYAEELRGWWGPPQAAIVDEFRERDGNRWIIENSHFYPGTWALQLGWNSGRAHKELVSRMSRMALWLFIIRDRGSGSVALDPAGEPLHYYPLSDELDQRHFRDGLASLIRLHEAAGAERIHYSIMGIEPWERGQDIERWTDRLRVLPFGLGGLPAGSAHQMGTARMGTDPATSVATPRGELHDAPGVWIGDTSAFPTASGGNPMFTCMALAHRTAENLLGDMP